MKLFIFEHCPFCIKTMMIVGLKKLDVQFITLQNHDVQSRIDKVGNNVVPILQKNDGSYQAESLDIVDYLDTFDHQPQLRPSTQQHLIDEWHEDIHTIGGRLLYPRWMKIALPEFATEEAKAWFTKNKSAMISMSFEQAFQETDILLPKLNQYLEQLEWLILPSEAGDTLSYDDINLFPTLRNFTVVKGAYYPDRVQQYVKEVSELTNIALFNEVAI